MQSPKNESSSDDLKSANRNANLTITKHSLHLKIILEKVNIKLVLIGLEVNPIVVLEFKSGQSGEAVRRKRVVLYVLGGCVGSGGGGWGTSRRAKNDNLRVNAAGTKLQLLTELQLLMDKDCSKKDKDCLCDMYEIFL
ncbi:hypothetical protein Tco_0296147 [Tanacetum coccineum]